MGKREGQEEGAGCRRWLKRRQIRATIGERACSHQHWARVRGRGVEKRLEGEASQQIPHVMGMGIEGHIVVDLCLGSNTICDYRDV